MPWATISLGPVSGMDYFELRNSPARLCERRVILSPHFRVILTDTLFYPSIHAAAARGFARMQGHSGPDVAGLPIRTDHLGLFREVLGTGHVSVVLGRLVPGILGGFGTDGYLWRVH